MDFENLSEAAKERLQKVGLYMATLQARMDPAQYDALADAVLTISRLMEKNREGSFDANDEQFTPEVRRELGTVLAILLTGRMDHHVVEFPGTDGGRSWAMVEADAADDPAKVQKIREDLERWTAEQRAVKEELDGIARASGIDSD